MEAGKSSHLVFYGLQTSHEPVKSALVVEDGHLAPEKTIELHRPKLEVAFLFARRLT